jgi:ankyrin repeat protein
VFCPTPLVYSICCGQLPFVGQLLSLGADVTKCVAGWRPIHFAAAAGDAAIVSALLAHSPDEANAAAASGALPLHFAATCRAAACAVALLQAGADPDAANAAGQTALHMAMCAGARELCEVLLAFGADVGARNQRGLTPAQVYAERHAAPPMDAFVARITGRDYRPPQREEVAQKYLVEKAADVREVVTVDGEDLIERLTMLDA